MQKCGLKYRMWIAKDEHSYRFFAGDGEKMKATNWLACLVLSVQLGRCAVGKQVDSLVVVGTAEL